MMRPLTLSCLLLLSTAATAQDALELEGYSGFIREEVTSRYETWLFTPNAYGYIETGGRSSSQDHVEFSISDGRARGSYSSVRRERETSRLFSEGKCLNGAPGRTHHDQTWTTDESASASGPATCEVYLDAYGGAIGCVSDVEFTRDITTGAHNDARSNCAEWFHADEHDIQSTTRDEFSFGISHAMEPDGSGTSPSVITGVEITDDGFERRTVSYLLSRESEYELLLEPQADYAQWRPKAGLSETERGNTLVVRATLRRKDGAPLDRSAKRISFRFSQRSHEPGLLMNFPEPSKDSPTLPDLRFEPELNAPFDLEVRGDFGEEAVTVEGDYETVYVQISSFDWGAYGALIAEAELPGGLRVAGRVDEAIAGGNPFELLIPKRRSVDDPIAESWRKAGAGRGGDGLSDDEELPAGDGHGGDGFSLYEEYRGFMVNYRRVEGDPERKDLFIHNMLGPNGVKGIALFAAQSELRVLAGLAATEMGLTRVINRNSSGRFQRTAQHGLEVKSAPAGQTYAAARGGPGTPRVVRAIELPLGMLTASSDTYIAATLAHELGHGVNVYHHGEHDHGPRIFRVDGAQVFERRLGTAPGSDGEVPVTIFYEDGSPMLVVDVKTDAAAWIGDRQGQHSGSDACVMRYDIARFHRRSGSGERFFNRGKEKVGSGFCGSPAGTGVNAPDHSPVPRYQGAAAGRGACRSQICVNDAHFHRRR